MRTSPTGETSAAISNAFVAVGVYCLNGIPDSDVTADPRARARTVPVCGDDLRRPDAQYNLAHMYIGRRRRSRQGQHQPLCTGWCWRPKRAIGPPRRCSAICCSPAKACQHQRGRGLMWLEIAANGATAPRTHGSAISINTISRGERRRPASRRRHVRCSLQGSAVAVDHFA